VPADLINSKTLSVLKMKTPRYKDCYYQALMAQSRLGHLCLKHGGYRVLSTGNRPSQFTRPEWRAMSLDERYEWTYWYYGLAPEARIAEDDAHAERAFPTQEDTSPLPHFGSKRSHRTGATPKNSKTDRRKRNRKAPPPWRTW
jgi:hypothetical protein